ncbi:hypothetical protein KFK09_024640 [Dendrobium nobile]|uniref:RING-type domain-containing protein n=1 Tax=Dendrobium nobile TaxID=94219 RepID=A0A8T3AFC8_DENNO|nr:hypothetical protein KFK09_024640 [Dendrobium nobile]
MVSIIHINDNIHIFYNRNFNISDIDDNAGEPYLLLSLVYNINGERMGDDDIVARSRHKFSDCNPSSLRDLIEEKEPIPLDTLVDQEDAEILRDRISSTITRLVCDCAGDEGLKMLQVVVLVEFNIEEEEYVYIESDDVELLRDRRMNLLAKNVYKNVAMAEKENDACSICLHEMRVGEEVACTPCCIHRFHCICISRWFEISGLCPLCRFNIDSF